MTRKKYILYAHHALYLATVAPIWLYGLSRYSGPPPAGGAGNSGPLAYSPLLTFLIYALLTYLALGFVSVCISMTQLIMHRKAHYAIAALANALLLTCLAVASAFMWGWLEEG